MTSLSLHGVSFVAGSRPIRIQSRRDFAIGKASNWRGSENPKLKHWDRGRYDKLQLNKWDMNEYVFDVNIGNDMVSVMHGLSVANGGAVKNEYLL